jgi:ABC-2 type transport system permease protein
MFTAFALSAFRVRSAYRAQIWAMLFGVGLDIFARISIWTAVFGGSDAVDGVTLPQMITYTVLGIAFLNAWDSTELVREVGADIRSGDVVNQLLKPYSYPMALLARQVGSRIFEFMLIGLPVVVVMGLAFGLEPPASLGHGVLFVFYCLVSVTMIMGIGILFGLLSFWVLDAHSLEWFMRGMVVILAGGFVPLWFFPAGLAEVAAVLPFSWITFHPMATYLGQVDVPTAALLLLAGMAWLAALYLLIFWLWSRTTSRLTVQGG